MGPDNWVPADCVQDFGLCSQSFHELQQGSVMIWLVFQERKTTQERKIIQEEAESREESIVII